jgi:hypothetical protein
VVSFDGLTTSVSAEAAPRIADKLARQRIARTNANALRGIALAFAGLVDSSIAFAPFGLED